MGAHYRNFLIFLWQPRKDGAPIHPLFTPKQEQKDKSVTVPYAGSGDVLTDRLYDMALQFHARDDREAAIDLLRQVRERAPSWAAAAFRLGEILMQDGQRDSAVAAFTDYLRLDPADIQGAVIKLCLLGAMKTPPFLPPDYIAGLFDEYAPRFEKHLIEKLSYTVPQQIADLIETLHPVATTAPWRILDCGCGTGLCGDWFSKRASWLEGIDISAGMIAEAARKGQYQQLHHADMLAALRADTRPFDLVLAADVLIYSGDLDPVFAAVASRLPAGGLFAFSVQLVAGDFYLLGADHRYGHSRAYVEDCARRHGFAVAASTQTILRQDAGQDVSGLLLVLRRHIPVQDIHAALPSEGTDNSASLPGVISPDEIH